MDDIINDKVQGDEFADVRANLKKYKALTELENELTSVDPNLPVPYVKEEVISLINELDGAINGLEELFNKIDNLKQGVLSVEETNEKLDEIIEEISQNEERRERLKKYKEINDKKEIIILEAILSTTKKRGDLVPNLLDDVKDQKISIGAFVNYCCINHPEIGKPFMVALLNMDPFQIYEYIVEDTGFTDEQKESIRLYIKYEKDRIATNLILSDKAIIDLLETTTGRNIIDNENIVSENTFYSLCRNCSLEVFKRDIVEVLSDPNPQISDPENVFNAFKSSSSIFNNLVPKDKVRIHQFLVDIHQQCIKQKLDDIRNKNANYRQMPDYNNLRRKISRELALLNPVLDKYDVISRRNNRDSSLTGNRIVTFKRQYIDPQTQSVIDAFDRTIDNMRIANFPISDVEKYLSDSFNSNKLSRSVKEQLIATVIDNLKLCCDIYDSYYYDGKSEVESKLKMVDGSVIKMKHVLNEANLPHVLGIAKSSSVDDFNNYSYNYPPETLDFLGIDKNRPVSAMEVLAKIFEKKDLIIQNLGCLTFADGTKHEMLPWEKIILKTNAFIRGDFFKSTAYITEKNPDSYLTVPGEKINALAINTTYFNNAPINQAPTKLTVSDFYRNGARITSFDFVKKQDLIIKGLLADIEQTVVKTYGVETNGRNVVKKINSVVTNESFVGETRVKNSGGVLRTLNRPAYLLENVRPGCFVEYVENPLGYKSFELYEILDAIQGMLNDFEGNKSVEKAAFDSLDNLKNRKDNYKNTPYGIDKFNGGPNKKK